MYQLLPLVVAAVSGVSASANVEKKVVKAMEGCQIVWEEKENCVMVCLVLLSILGTSLAELTTETVPLYSDCRFWVDPATHMRHLRQQMASFREIFANSMNNNCFISSERARNEPQSVVLVEHQDRAVHCLQDLLSARIGKRY